MTLVLGQLCFNTKAITMAVHKFIFTEQNWGMGLNTNQNLRKYVEKHNDSVIN